MGNRTIKRCSASLVIRGRQIKAAVRDHSPSTRMDIIIIIVTATMGVTSADEDVGRGPLHCWCGCTICSFCGKQEGKYRISHTQQFHS